MEDTARREPKSAATGGRGGGLNLSLLYATLLDFVGDNGSVTVEQAVEAIRAPLSNQLSRIEHLYGARNGEGVTAFVAEALGHLVARGLLAQTPEGWARGAGFKLNEPMLVLPARARSPGTAISHTVVSREARERLAATDLVMLATDQLEAIVTEGQQTFVRVGLALKALQERRAYLDRGYASFGDYCRALWGFNRQYGYRLVQAAETVALLVSPIGDTSPPPEPEELRVRLEVVEEPPQELPVRVRVQVTPGEDLPLPPPANEAQARALAPLRDRPGALGEAWRRAVETAPGGKVTAQHVARVVETVRRERDEAEAWQERRVEAQKAGRQAALERRQAESLAPMQEREAARAARNAAHGGPPVAADLEVTVDLSGAPPSPPAPTEYRFTVQEDRHPDGTVDAERDWAWEGRGPVERLLDAAEDLTWRIEEATDRHHLSELLQHEQDARRDAVLAARGPWMETLTEPEAVQLVSLLAQAHDRLAEALALVETIRSRGAAEEGA